MISLKIALNLGTLTGTMEASVASDAIEKRVAKGLCWWFW